MDIRQTLAPATAAKKMEAELLFLFRDTWTISLTTKMRRDLGGEFFRCPSMYRVGQ